MVFVSQTRRVFLPAAHTAACLVHSFRGKTNHLVLNKALEISSAFGQIGTLDLWSNTNVEFELYPPSESKAEVIGQNAFKCHECYY